MKRILVGSDLSPCSSNALARAIWLAAEDGAAIHIVHGASEADNPKGYDAGRRRIITEAQIIANEGANILDSVDMGHGRLTWRRV